MSSERLKREKDGKCLFALRNTMARISVLIMSKPNAITTILSKIIHYPFISYIGTCSRIFITLFFKLYKNIIKKCNFAKKRNISFNILSLCKIFDQSLDRKLLPRRLLILVSVSTFIQGAALLNSLVIKE